MHFYMIAKGTKPSIEKWQEDLRALWLPQWKDGKKVFKGRGKSKGMVCSQLSVRPVQLIEIGFYKENLDKVLNCVGYSDYVLKRYPRLNLIAKGLRKFLGLKKAPKPKNPESLFQPNPINKAVAIVPIGLKDDMMSDDFMEQV